ncbi:MAG TPA: hypothetical protein GX714_14480 [Chloroflexi bacterium]|jgi:hypothetical protein|nr:hypothetical protein [Chloroflexota bacterium]
MLNTDGSFSFTEEVLAQVDAFLAEYEQVQGPLTDALERGLVVSYALGAMLCDLELVWEALCSAPIFGQQNPRALWEECVRRNADRSAERDEIAAELVRHGWVHVEAEEEETTADVGGSAPAEA